MWSWWSVCGFGTATEFFGIIICCWWFHSANKCCSLQTPRAYMFQWGQLSDSSCPVLAWQRCGISPSRIMAEEPHVSSTLHCRLGKWIFAVEQMHRFEIVAFTKYRVKETRGRGHSWSFSPDVKSSLTDQLDVRQLQCSTVGDRAFAVDGARLWNSLPHDIIASGTLSRFHHELKTFLFRQSYSSVLFYLSIYLKSQDYGDVGAEAQQGRLTM